jgi:hypothetical protein
MTSQRICKSILTRCEGPPPVDDALTHSSTQNPPTQGALESKRDPGTLNGIRCEGPPPVDDALTHCSTQDPHPGPTLLWNPREIQAPGMGLEVRAHQHQWMMHSPRLRNGTAEYRQASQEKRPRQRNRVIGAHHRGTPEEQAATNNQQDSE